MFSWFLKLLGINEDRPAASNNSLLNTTPAQAAETPTPAAEKSEPEAVSEPEPAPEVEVEVEEKLKEEPEKPKQATKTAPEPKAEPEPEPAAETKSLADEFPGLKANFVKVLTEAGFDSRKAIEKATDKELLTVKGIGQATVKILRN